MKTVNRSLLGCFFGLFVGIALALSSCYPETFLPTSTIQAEQNTIVAERPHTPTIEPTLPIEKTQTPLPSKTPPPSFVLSPFPSPTPLPWMIPEGVNGFFFNRNHQIYFFDGLSSRFVSKGIVLLDMGEPWSPDVTQFIFDAKEEPVEPSVLAIANLQTGVVTKPTFIGQPYTAYWSPDGRFIAYLQNDLTELLTKIIVYDVQTAENHILTEIEHETRPFKMSGWSPDGQKLTFVTKLNGQYDLFAFDVKRLTLQQLTNTPDVETFVAWRPGTTQLLVGTNPDEFSLYNWPFLIKHLFVIDESGNSIIELGDKFDRLVGISWSPDGMQISFSLDHAFCLLEMVNYEINCPLETILPIEQYVTGGPFAWSQDGNSVAFQAYSAQDMSCPPVYWLDLLSNQLTLVPSTPCNGTWIYWIPRTSGSN